MNKSVVNNVSSVAIVPFSPCDFDKDECGWDISDTVWQRCEELLNSMKLLHKLY